jgi:hypothetical protein
MENAERTAIDMVRRYRTREAAIQQAHANDVEAITDEERRFWRTVLAKLRSYGSLPSWSALSHNQEKHDDTFQGDHFAGAVLKSLLTAHPLGLTAGTVALAVTGGADRFWVIFFCRRELGVGQRRLIVWISQRAHWVSQELNHGNARRFGGAGVARVPRDFSHAGAPDTAEDPSPLSHRKSNTQRLAAA